MNICGIDEAGRGPLIGPMVLAGAMLKEEDIPKLKELGVKDSKLISPKRREQLYKILINLVKYKIIIIEPQEIDNNVNGDGTNLNKLEAFKSVEIINQLKPNKAILDCPSNNIKAYNDLLKELCLHKDINIIAEHKADANHLIVGAASIIAKVTRDNEIENIKKKIGIDFGSGYMTDPKTTEFLKKHWQTHSGIFRHSWAPYHKMQHGQKKIGEY